jgi:hypothetical protein
MPRGYDPLVDTLDQASLRQNLERMQAWVRQVAGGMPSHGAYIAAHCAANGTTAQGLQAVGGAR